MDVSTARPGALGPFTRQQRQQNAGPRSNSPDTNPARRVIDASEAARQRSENRINSNQLALYKRPQVELLAPPPASHTTVSSITARFEAQFREAVEKGRIVDTRA